MDKNKFTQAVLEAESTLYHVSKTILFSDADCEDAVQNAILKGFENISTLREEKYFKTWLIRILINECYKLHKAKKPTISFEEYGEIEIPPVEDYTELYKAVFALPEKIKITVVLFYLEGYSVEEIKGILKVPAGTVKSRLSKGRRLLEKFLKDKEVLA